MATPIQTQIVDVIGTRLANITIANGYFTTANKIKRAQLTPFVSGDLPAVNYWIGEDILTNPGGGYEDRALNVFVEYHTKNRDRPFSDVAAELANDVWTALWRAPGAPAVSDAVSANLGGLVSGITLSRYVPEIGEGQAPWCGVLIEIIVLYQSGPDGPLTLLT